MINHFFRNLKTKHDYYAISLIVFFSAFKILESDEWVLESPPAFIEILQRIGNPLVLLIMLLSVMKSSLTRKFELRKNSSSLFYYFIFSLVVILFGKPIAYDKIIALFIILIFFLHVVPRLFFFHKNDQCIIKALSKGLIAITLVNLLLIVKFPSSVMWKARLFGTPYHPNFMGLILAINICISFYLLLLSSEKIKLKAIHIINILISFILCYLTGSRTSLGLAFVSILIIIFFRIKSIPFKIIILGLVSLIFLLFSISNSSINQLDYAGRGNTREEAWSIMLSQVLEFPILGIGKTGWTANSYLFSIIAAGVFGAFFFYMSIYKVISNVKLNIRKENKIIYQALLVIILSGALMEGYLLDSISVPIIIYWFLLTYPLIKKNNENLSQNII